MKAERTPWFNGSTEKAKRPGWYETRCLNRDKRVNHEFLIGMYNEFACPYCEWRGLTERGLAQWKRGAR